MSTTPNKLDNMLAMWNERDLSRIRGHLEAALTPDVTFIDPTIETHGLDEFEKNVRDFRTKYPQASIRRASAIDSHHNLHRYSWEITVEGKVFLVGYDVAETVEDGKVCRVLGFFGPLPKLSE
ncbi:MAG: nuclear transport factor 2 family protein [Burkholderiaceae bacterium]